MRTQDEQNTQRELTIIGLNFDCLKELNTIGDLIKLESEVLI